jgi:hypothetical protein
MTTNDEHRLLGLQIHFLRSRIVPTGSADFPTGEVVRRGDSITLDETILELSRDRNGFSPYDLADDTAAQIERWGEQRYGVGPFPAHLPKWRTLGDGDWLDAREQANRQAWAQPEGPGRDAALREVRRTFGSVPTSTTLQGRPR